MKLGFLLVFLASGPALAELRVTAISVGYADSYLMTWEEQGQVQWAGLVDAGGPHSFRRIRRVLKRYRVRALDAVFLTHPHDNHYGGLRKLARAYRIREFLWAGAHYDDTGFEPVLAFLKKKGVPVSVVKRGWERWVRPGFSLTVLHPTRVAESIHQDNLVLLVTHGKNGFLFAGDLEPVSQPEVLQEAEPRLADRESRLQWATWPHHGDTLHPAWAARMHSVPWKVFSTGKNPRGLPTPEIFASCTERCLRTDVSGTLTFISHGEDLQCLNRP